MSYPRVIWSENKLLHNAAVLQGLCKQQGVTWVPVTKLICAEQEIVTSLYKKGYTSFADSRVKNIKSIKRLFPQSFATLLRLPAIREVKEVVLYTDCSLVSEWETIQALDEEAKKQKKIYQIILMVDLGDLREGILPNELISFGQKILKLAHIQWEGIGTNLTCYGGVIPTPNNLSQLVNLKELVKDKLKYELKIVSGGNSSSLYLLPKCRLPQGINQLRLGESLFLGKETAYGNKILDCYEDVFHLEAEIIELKEKGSVPKGIIGKNAFGKTPTFQDLGIRKRAILAIGQQDVYIEGLTPVSPDIIILGASSDHLIVDVTMYQEEIKVGSIISFSLNYKSLLILMTSPYVMIEKNY
ncbi:alanine/ornithine racemase family PLP-dependent enzyme [Bacillaceae bacterium IKA-2]|nr:alanine/ornithine racemase family PLP-dependent enzyme [Bacillaceae bacterium IKA-2]